MENKVNERNFQQVILGGCQMLFSADCRTLSSEEILEKGSIFFCGQITWQEGGIQSAVRGKKEKASPVLLKGSFMSLS